MTHLNYFEILQNTWVDKVLIMILKHPFLKFSLSPLIQLLFCKLVSLYLNSWNMTVFLSAFKMGIRGNSSWKHNDRDKNWNFLIYIFLVFEAWTIRWSDAHLIRDTFTLEIKLLVISISAGHGKPTIVDYRIFNPYKYVDYFYCETIFSIFIFGFLDSTCFLHQQLKHSINLPFFFWPPHMAREF